MKTSRFLLGAFLLCILPTTAHSQQDQNIAPYPLVTPEEAMNRLWAVPIKLHLTNVRLYDALCELIRQSHVPVSFPTFGYNIGYDQRVSTDIETPFFQTALAALTKSAWVERMGHEATWQMNKTWVLSSLPSPFSGPISRRDTFEVRLNTTESVRSQEFGEDHPYKDSRDRLSFSFGSDPRFVFVGAPQIRVTRALNAQGEPITQELQTEIATQWIPDEETDEFTIDTYTGSPEKPNHISALEGTLVYTVPVQQEHWMVGNIAEGDTPSRIFQCGGQQVRISIHYYVRARNEIKLILQVQALQNGLPAKTSLPLSAKQVLYRMKVYDWQSRSITSSGYDAKVESQGQSFIVANFLAPAEKLASTPAQPISLSLDIPTQFVQTEVPFSFSNLPLP